MYIKEKGGQEKDWKYVGSMAVPRTTKVDVAIFENEVNLVKVRTRTVDYQRMDSFFVNDAAVY